MKKMAAGAFKSPLFGSDGRKFSRKRESVLITKRGKPVAKLVPVEKNPDDIFNFMKGNGSIVGDVVSPAFSPRVQPRRLWKSVLILLDTHVVQWVAFDAARLSRLSINN